LSFSFFASMDKSTEYISLVFVPVAARSVAALGINVLRPLSHSQFSGEFKKKQKVSHTVVLAAMLVLSVCIPQVFCSLKAMVAPAAAALAAIIALVLAVRNLGGMSGDISGYSITIGECAGAAALMAIYLI